MRKIYSLYLHIRVFSSSSFSIFQAEYVRNVTDIKKNIIYGNK